MFRKIFTPFFVAALNAFDKMRQTIISPNINNITIAQEKGVPQRILLPQDDVIVFEAPINFQKALRQMRDDLENLDAKAMPVVMMEMSRNGIPYDFKSHERSLHLALAEAVRPIGWTARGTFHGSVLSYYWIQMSLVFHKFKIELREAMLASLNAGLVQIGKKMGFTGELQITGLPTIYHVDDALKKLNAGNLAYTEVMAGLDQG